jgi:hypothetical protein
VSKLGTKERDKGSDYETGTLDASKLGEYNLTNVSFFIQKAAIEVNSGGVKESMLASIKYRYPDSYIISLRTRTGIEAARVLIRSDSVFINDRINRVLYYGSSKAVMNRYGLRNDIIRVFFGDYVTSASKLLPEYKCNKGVTTIETVKDGLRAVYIIDCKSKRALSVSVFKDRGKDPVLFTFEDYQRIGNISFGNKVTINNIYDYERISIEYSKVESPWEGSFVFIPGRNFEYIEIR